MVAGDRLGTGDKRRLVWTRTESEAGSRPGQGSTEWKMKRELRNLTKETDGSGAGYLGTVVGAEWV